MKKKYLIGGSVILVVVLLLSWGKLFGGKAVPTFWKETTVACLPNGHTNLAFHIHQDVAIIVDGAVEQIPANVGITPTCMAELHTHDGTSKLHEEGTDATRTFKLKDFFTVWGNDIVRDGYTLAMTVDAAANTELGELILKDGQKIILTYTKTAETVTQ